MKTYKVTYTETLVHAFFVEANNEEEAQKVFEQGLMDDAFDLSGGEVTEADYKITESDDIYHYHHKVSDDCLVCKACGYKQDDEETVEVMKKRFPDLDEHDIPYYCGACMDNANDDEYMEMEQEMCGLECPLGGDETNDCEGCAYSCEYHFVNGECVARKGKEEER